MKIELNSVFEYLKGLDIEYNYYGNNDMELNKYSSFNNIISNSITWVKNKSYYKECLLEGLKDTLVIVNSDVDINDTYNDKIGFIVCNDPKQMFFSILNQFFKQEEYGTFLGQSSIVETKIIGENVYIGHNCYIGKHVKIGDNVIIKNNVSIEGNTVIGKNSILHSGIVIGTDGFGYFKNGEGMNMKVPHYGGVIIGDDVEIGANTCIDRGTLDDTLIGNNVKIDNLCHIGHNVVIKDNSSVIALSMLGGSAILEKNSYIAPGAIIKNQIIIGENSLVGMGSVVTHDVEENKIVAGVPAKVIRDNI